ncbi:hypothetical protein C5613_18665 [Rhodococcus opacus]|uniref:Uncharacterized protein n=1 Tax=Rhodococcus opacus TaxID=37919 RepID=A0A2S8J8U2_RHOOP|nr:hypothetical protein C5613_18665 [Rhodococcus opacus]
MSSELLVLNQTPSQQVAFCRQFRRYSTPHIQLRGDQCSQRRPPPVQGAWLRQRAAYLASAGMLEFGYGQPTLLTGQPWR